MKSKTFIRKRMGRGLVLIALFMITGLSVNFVEAQNTLRTVKGVVTDIDGPLENAAVVLKGTAVSATTDKDGRFVFPKPLNTDDVLVVMHIGYKNREVVIGADTSFLEIELSDYEIVLIGAVRMGDNNTSEQ